MWEYWVTTINITEDSEAPDRYQSMRLLDACGEDGWEVVAAWPAPGANNSGTVYVIMKRLRTSSYRPK